MSLIRTTFSLLLGLVPALVAAQLPVGDEFQVNTYTTGYQRKPSIGPDGAGGFIVVWNGKGSGTDTGIGIQAQRYASDATPVGGEFQINTYTTGLQYNPAVSSDGVGGFVVSWDSRGSPGSDVARYSIQARRYTANGLPAGPQFQVNTYTASYQLIPAVSPIDTGGFVVAWASDGSSGSDSSSFSIQAQRFAADGLPAGSEFQVNTDTIGLQYAPAVGPDGAGGFVITWDNYTSLQGIQAQRYAADGSPIGGQFQVNTLSGSSRRPAIGPDGAGGFVIVWESYASSGSDTSHSSIQAQRFSADGSPEGSQFQVNTYTHSEQAYSAVSSDGADGFIVTWRSLGSLGTDSSFASVQGQRYAADGSPVGPEFQVNSYTTGSQSYPDVGLDGAGGFVVTWDSEGSSGTDTSQYSIQAQRYLRLEIFEDGFESGDLSAWSQSLP